MPASLPKHDAAKQAAKSKYSQAAFSFAKPATTTFAAGNKSDIDVDLGLQQALLQSHQPSHAVHMYAWRASPTLLCASLPLCKELKPVADCIADTADEADDIELDLGLQQAMLQSHRNSPAALHINASPVKDITHPAALHTKANTLKDITNWNLPIPAPVQAQKARVPTPLMALAGKAGTAAEAI